MTNFFPWVLESYGLNHIGTNIFSQLDMKSLLNCQMVCKQWNEFIKENKQIWKQQIRNVQYYVMKNHLGRSCEHGHYILRNAPALLKDKFCCLLPKTLVHYEEKENYEMKAFIKFIHEFLNIDWSQKDPHNCEDFMLCSCQGLIFFALQTDNELVSRIFFEIQQYTSERQIEKMDLTVCYHCANGNISNLKFALLVCKCLPFESYGGRNALHYAFQNGKFKIIKALLDNAGPNLDINAQNNMGRTVLHLACRAGRCEIVKLLLEQGSRLDVNIEDYHGYSPLHIACKAQNIKIVEALCQNPMIDVNATDYDGNTPLHIACNRNNCKLYNILMKHPNIDVNAKNDNGVTPKLYDGIEANRKRKHVD